MIEFNIDENIYYDIFYLKNGSVQSGKSLTYEIYNESRSLVFSGSLSEQGSTGLYYFSVAHTFISNTRLNLYIKESTKFIQHEQIVIKNGLDSSDILNAIEDADRYSDGNTI